MSVREEINTARWVIFGMTALVVMVPVVLGAALDLWDRVRGGWHDYTSGRDG